MYHPVYKILVDPTPLPEAVLAAERDRGVWDLGDGVRLHDRQVELDGVVEPPHHRLVDDDDAASEAQQDDAHPQQLLPPRLGPVCKTS